MPKKKFRASSIKIVEVRCFIIINSFSTTAHPTLFVPRSSPKILAISNAFLIGYNQSYVVKYKQILTKKQYISLAFIKHLFKNIEIQFYILSQ